MKRARPTPGDGVGAAFWNARLHRFGHTGWKDSIIYAYDQLERLELVRRIVPAAPESAEMVAIDFGCGVGDFSRLLLELGYRVWGHDPFVEPAVRSPRFTYLRDLDQQVGPPLGAEVALSVTALDHILDDSAFLSALAWLRTNLARSGRLVALEYALDEEAGPATAPSRYQAFRSLAQWQAALTRSGFVLDRVTRAPHPIDAPSAGYLAYRRQPVVRLFALPGMRRLAVVRGWARGAALRALTRYPPVELDEGASPLKLLIARARV